MIKKKRVGYQRGIQNLVRVLLLINRPVGFTRYAWRRQEGKGLSLY
jgi:hypothetical protein